MCRAFAARACPDVRCSARRPASGSGSAPTIQPPNPKPCPWCRTCKGHELGDAAARLNTSVTPARGGGAASPKAAGAASCSSGAAGAVSPSRQAGLLLRCDLAPVYATRSSCAPPSGWPQAESVPGASKRRSEQVACSSKQTACSNRHLHTTAQTAHAAAGCRASTPCGRSWRAACAWTCARGHAQLPAVSALGSACCWRGAPQCSYLCICAWACGCAGVLVYAPGLVAARAGKRFTCSCCVCLACLQTVAAPIACLLTGHSFCRSCLRQALAHRSRCP